MSFVRNITCSKCGAEYELFSSKTIMRDIDSEECDLCGNELISWNGAIMYYAKLVKGGKVEEK